VFDGNMAMVGAKQGVAVRWVGHQIYLNIIKNSAM
jgi:hypothetical protein